MKKIIGSMLLFVSISSFASAESFSDYATVRGVEPHYLIVETEVPVKKCRDVEVIHEREGRPQQQASSSGVMGDNPMGAIVGGAVGGILGHQVGGGQGKTAATIGGAIIGATVGQKALTPSGSSAQQPATQASNSSYTTIEQRCDTVYEKRREERSNGYTVMIDFHGRMERIQSQRLYHVGDRIDVQVHIPNK